MGGAAEYEKAGRGLLPHIALNLARVLLAAVVTSTGAASDLPAEAVDDVIICGAKGCWRVRYAEPDPFVPAAPTSPLPEGTGGTITRPPLNIFIISDGIEPPAIPTSLGGTKPNITILNGVFKDATGLTNAAVSVVMQLYPAEKINIFSYSVVTPFGAPANNLEGALEYARANSGRLDVVLLLYDPFLYQSRSSNILEGRAGVTSSAEPYYVEQAGSGKRVFPPLATQTGIEHVEREIAAHPILPTTQTATGAWNFTRPEWGPAPTVELSGNYQDPTLREMDVVVDDYLKQAGKDKWHLYLDLLKKIHDAGLPVVAAAGDAADPDAFQTVVGLQGEESVITVGAAAASADALDANGGYATTTASAKGPSRTGGVKPDLLAPGYFKVAVPKGSTLDQAACGGGSYPVPFACESTLTSTASGFRWTADPTVAQTVSNPIEYGTSYEAAAVAAIQVASLKKTSSHVQSAGANTTGLIRSLLQTRTRRLLDLATGIPFPAYVQGSGVLTSASSPGDVTSNPLPLRSLNLPSVARDEAGDVWEVPLFSSGGGAATQTVRATTHHLFGADLIGQQESLPVTGTVEAPEGVTGSVTATATATAGPLQMRAGATVSHAGDYCGWVELRNQGGSLINYPFCVVRGTTLRFRITYPHDRPVVGNTISLSLYRPEMSHLTHLAPPPADPEGVLDYPVYASTSAQDGYVTLRNVPPGWWKMRLWFDATIVAPLAFQAQRPENFPFPTSSVYPPEGDVVYRPTQIGRGTNDYRTKGLVVASFPLCASAPASPMPGGFWPSCTPRYSQLQSVVTTTVSKAVVQGTKVKPKRTVSGTVTFTATDDDGFCTVTQAASDLDINFYCGDARPMVPPALSSHQVKNVTCDELSTGLSSLLMGDVPRPLDYIVKKAIPTGTACATPGGPGSFSWTSGTAQAQLPPPLTPTQVDCQRESPAGTRYYQASDFTTATMYTTNTAIYDPYRRGTNPPLPVGVAKHTFKLPTPNLSMRMAVSLNYNLRNAAVFAVVKVGLVTKFAMVAHAGPADPDANRDGLLHYLTAGNPGSDNQLRVFTTSTAVYYPGASTIRFYTYTYGATEGELYLLVLPTAADIPNIGLYPPTAGISCLSYQIETDGEGKFTKIGGASSTRYALHFSTNIPGGRDRSNCRRRLAPIDDANYGVPSGTGETTATLTECDDIAVYFHTPKGASPTVDAGLVCLHGAGGSCVTSGPQSDRSAPSDKAPADRCRGPDPSYPTATAATPVTSSAYSGSGPLSLDLWDPCRGINPFQLPNPLFAPGGTLNRPLNPDPATLLSTATVFGTMTVSTNGQYAGVAAVTASMLPTAAAMIAEFDLPTASAAAPLGNRPTHKNPPFTYLYYHPIHGLADLLGLYDETPPESNVNGTPKPCFRVSQSIRGNFWGFSWKAPMQLCDPQLVRPVITAPREGDPQLLSPVVVAGNANPRAEVRIWKGEYLQGSTIADANGNFTLPIHFANGTHAITATQTDAYGRTSPPTSTSFTLTALGADAPPTATLLPFYHLYKLYHVYTVDEEERAARTSTDTALGGWTLGGKVGKCYSSEVAGTTPLYRLTNGSDSSDRFYTRDPAEANVARAAGWQWEGIPWQGMGVACWVFASQVAGTTPLYRLQLNAPFVYHFYTIDKALRDRLIASGQWLDELIEGYLVM